ncbi:hypothetical protein [Streptomyces roseolus]|uniref:hypothetical protein n=1 Tax=Streptomyces roseolus TaxID=67358 RepID=UPI00365A6926
MPPTGGARAVPRADALVGESAGRVPWRAERRRTYDGVVAVPRPLAHCREDEPLPLPALTEARGLLVVMGGSCRRTRGHAVPKTGRAVGPRTSARFRPRGVA